MQYRLCHSRCSQYTKLNGFKVRLPRRLATNFIELKFYFVIYIIFFISISEFENSIVTPKTLQDFINMKDANDSLKSGKNVSKDSYLTLTFKTELSELSFKNVKKIILNKWFFEPEI